MMRKTLITLCTFALLSIPAHANQDYLEDIDNFIVDIQINENNSITVTEKIQYDFGLNERHGIIREIPLSYGDQNDVTIELEVLSVTDENNNPHPYQDSGAYYKEIKIGDPDIYVTGSNWYHITYTFSPIITGFTDYDELFWNVTGTDWTVPIHHAEATVKLPPSQNAALDATCYDGFYGSNDENCSASVLSNKNTYHFEADDLGIYEGLTIVASFEKGIVQPLTILKVTTLPTYAEVLLNGEETYHATPYSFLATDDKYEVTVKKRKYISQTKEINIIQGQTNTLDFQLEESPLNPFIETYIPIALLIGGLYYLYRRWYLFGREPEGRGTIVPNFLVPDKLTPGELGVIVDQKAHLHDISATIIWLAEQGYLKIKREETKKKKKPKFSFIKVKTPKKIPEYAKSIFDGIFKDAKSKTVKLSDLKNKFYIKLPDIKKELYKRVVDKKYFVKDPAKVRLTYWIIGGIGLFSSNFLGLGLAFYTDSFLYGTTFYILSIVMTVMAFWMPRRTPKGQDLYEKILGLKMYLKTAEKHRFAKLHTPKQFRTHFEKLLPFAIALEVEEKWAKQFEEILKDNPTWYQSTRPFSTSEFTSSFATFQRLATGALTSRPGGSSGGSGWSGGSSGFSSGSFSGGGFGGGGGSSW